MSSHKWDENDVFGWVLNNDQQVDGPSGWIQWKGTDVCIDLHCACGSASHYHGDFLYYYECSQCHRRYAVGQTVKLIELTSDIQQRYAADIKDTDFKTVDEPWA